MVVYYGNMVLLLLWLLYEEDGWGRESRVINSANATGCPPSQGRRRQTILIYSRTNNTTTQVHNIIIFVHIILETQSQYIIYIYLC